jgi:hypothetical protein
MPQRDEEENPLAEVETYDMAEELCDRMELPPKNRAQFIEECMTRSGYAPVQSRDAYRRIPKKDDDEERQENSRWGFGSGPAARKSPRRANRPGSSDYDPDKF